MRVLLRRIRSCFWGTRLRRMLAIAVIMFGVMPLGSIELTSQSWFCNSCHIMNSYYASWKTGTHKDVECVQCHIPPGAQNYLMAKLNGAGQVVDDLLDRTNSKPSAVVSDNACARSGCHAIETIRKSARRDGKFFFDHGKHLNVEYLGIEIHCTTCHSHVKAGKHFEVNTGACITCHLTTPGASAVPVKLVSTTTQNAAASGKPAEKAPPGDCKNCHEPPRQMIEYRGLKVLHSDYLAYGAKCESCHRDVTAKPQKIDEDHCLSCHEFGMERMTSVEELHRQHSIHKHKVECFNCHGTIRHGPTAQSMQLDQLDCQSCHSGQHSIQQKTYKVAAHQPSDASAISPMYLAHVACTGCHAQPRPITLKGNTGATVAMASASSCDSCHEKGLGERMVPLWQNTTRKLYNDITKMLPAETQALSREDQQLVTEVKGLLEVVRLDGSWGVHNPLYTQKLLEQAQEKLARIQDSVKVTTK